MRRTADVTESVRETARDAAGRIQQYLGSGDTREDSVTKFVESQTARVPSIAYLSFGIVAMAASLMLLMTGRKQTANFVGQWVPTILIMGLYNKVVKQLGSD